MTPISIKYKRKSKFIRQLYYRPQAFSNHDFGLIPCHLEGTNPAINLSKGENQINKTLYGITYKEK
jgi:hypothetical protein